jgi:hypothetical protein
MITYIEFIHTESKLGHDCALQKASLGMKQLKAWPVGLADYIGQVIIYRVL